MSKALVLITGANNGLGYYAAQQLASTGHYHILLASRSLPKGEAAKLSLLSDPSHPIRDPTCIQPIQLDVLSDPSLLSASSLISSQFGYLDILISNAGISLTPSPETLSSLPLLRQNFRDHFETNVFGATLVVEALLPLLRNSTHPMGKRIAFTSSGLSSITNTAKDEGPFGTHAHVYRASKAGLNMFAVYYAKTLGKEGFVVAVTDPGYCATDLNGRTGTRDPREGAGVIVRGITGKKEEVHGRLVDGEGVLPW